MPTRLPPAWVVRPLLAVRNGVDRLHDAMVPAELVLFERTVAVIETKAVAVVADLGVPDHLGDGRADAEALAAACGADADALERLLRFLAARGVFKRDRRGGYRNNRVSRLLRDGTGVSFRSWSRFFGAHWHLRIWNELGHSVRTGESAAVVAFDRPFWEQLTEVDADAGALFAAAMEDASRLQTDLVPRAYDFSGCHRVCDVGGGTGTLLSGILRANPDVRGTLYDLPSVVAKAPPLLEAAGVADRVDVVGGDFFASAPEGCDRYLLQAIVHDWDDESCVRILTNIREVMAPDARVLVLEQEVQGGHWHLALATDLEMLVDTGAGRERTRAEFETLFARAGLRVVSRRALVVTTIYELAAA